MAGGNYGWRVYEGSGCSNTDTSLCTPGRFISPLFDYLHTNGRCAITGGYVYRGPSNALPSGTYIYGDYCSGEIFAWDGRSQQILLSTGGAISSFGEDEDGELYVVFLGGTISKLVDLCTVALSPASQRVGAGGGAGSFAVSVPSDCAWTAVPHVSWIRIDGGGSGNGDGMVAFSVAPYIGHVRTRTGTITIGGEMFFVQQSR